MKPKLSAIIPAFNCQTSIEFAVKSIIDQQYDNLEIIIINDRSSDGTFEAAKKLAATFPQIVVCENERSKGPSGARNTGLEMATGEYVAFLDADDVWLPNHLNHGVGFLGQHHDVSVVFFNFEMVDAKSNSVVSNWFRERHIIGSLRTTRLQEEFYLIDDDMFDALLSESFMHLQSMIVRRTACDGVFFDENVMRSEDRDFAIKLAVESKARFAFRDLITGIYYRHENSLTSSSLENSISTANDHIFLFAKYLREYDLSEAQRKRLNDLLCNRYLWRSYYYRKSSCFGLALKSLIWSSRYGARRAQLVELAKTLVEACAVLGGARSLNKRISPDK